MDLFTDSLARAIAHAPDMDEAMRLWGTDPRRRPTVAQVLGHALVAGNDIAVKACAQVAVDHPLSIEEHSQALSQWRRSPTANWTLPAQIERRVGRILAKDGLVQADTLLLSGGADNQHRFGPIAWCADKFLPHAAMGMLGGFTQPNAEDMAQALMICVDRLAAPRQNEQDWTGLLEALLAKGADPSHTSTYGRNTMRTSAADQVVQLATKWSRHPVGLIKRLMGPAADSFTRVSGNGHTPLSRWIQNGGDEQMALRLADGQSLDEASLERLIERYMANTKKRDTEFFAAMPRHLSLPQMDAERAATMMHDTCIDVVADNAPQYPERVLYKAGMLICRCAPEDERKALTGHWNALMDIMASEPSSRWSEGKVHEKLRVQMDAWTLARGTPEARAARPSLRL